MSSPRKSEWNPFSTEQWIAWVGATIMAVLTLTAYVYANFETKGESEKVFGLIEKRLDRIENKLDQLLTR